ncbi:MAG: SDR family oxidoreductase [Clostridia bacterium]|nr:SDR family oxidoreductase [Clostridia bacterium]
MKLDGKLAVITGAGSGIGRQTAVRLAKVGADIFLFGGRNLENLQETAKLVERENRKCYLLSGDITSESFQTQGVCEVEKLGGVDILVNNAGMAFNRPFEQTDRDVFDKIMNINVKTPYFLIKAFLPQLKKSDWATVINICSVVSHAGYPLQSAYVASKHALLGLTKSLASEVYEQGIRVHAISPGGVYTDMVKIARPDLTDEGMIKPSEIAEIIAFLVENRGNAVIDEIIVHRVNKQPFLV